MGSEVKTNISNVQNARLYKKRSKKRRLDFLIFLLSLPVFALLLLGRLTTLRISIVITLFVIELILICLQYWIIPIRLLVGFKPVDTVTQASHVYFKPEKAYGESCIEIIHRHDVRIFDAGTQDLTKGEMHIFNRLDYRFEFYVRYQDRICPFDPNTGMLRELRSIHVNELFLTEDIYRWQGWENEDAVNELKKVYPDNVIYVKKPSFITLYIEHLLAPFFVFQVISIILWIFDEHVFFSLLSLVMLMTLEGHLVKTQMKSRAELHSLSQDNDYVKVRRSGEWINVTEHQLVPGDLIALEAPTNEKKCHVPCDILVLSGSCVVSEAMLTGESVPLPKTPWNTRIECDLAEIDKRHVLNMGTELVRVMRSQKNRASNPEVIGLVLRTGFSTEKGKLVNSILYSSTRLSVNNVETGVFVFCLFLFAVVVCFRLYRAEILNPTVPKSSLYLNMLLIITSVVPSELPVSLSLAVSSALVFLGHKRIFCTEPFRIPLAGSTQLCCFDKTGTLTDSTIHFNNVVCYDKETKKYTASSVLDAPDYLARWNLACCHTVVKVSNEHHGDAAEIAALEASGFAMGRSSDIYPVNCKNLGIPSKEVPVQLQLERDAGLRFSTVNTFSFSSEKQRSSVIVRMECRNTPAAELPYNEHIVFAKGAPEKMIDLFALDSVPDDYDSELRRITLDGNRVLAMGYRFVDNDKVTREEAESELVFCGFIALNAAIREDSFKTLAKLKKANIKSVIITGDHALTSCHVAFELAMFQKWNSFFRSVNANIIQRILKINIQKTSLNKERIPLLLQRVPHSESYDLEWLNPRTGATEKFKPWSPPSISEHALVMSGKVVEMLIEIPVPSTGETARLRRHFSNAFEFYLYQTTVFARTLPVQKQLIVNSFRQLGTPVTLKALAKYLAKCHGKPYVLDKVAGEGTTIMCGDGTNDVGALKSAHVGVALMDNVVENYVDVESDDECPVSTLSDVFKDFAAFTQPPTPTDPEGVYSRRKRMREAYQKRMRRQGQQYQQEEEAPPVIKPGDASLAAHVSSTKPSPYSLVRLIRQGRCSLISQLQVYRILAVNAVVNSYTMSILFRAGIRLSDKQHTVMGLLQAVALMFITKSYARKDLHQHPPARHVFCFSMIFTLIGQVLVHLGTLHFAMIIASRIDLSLGIAGSADPSIDIEFAPSVSNTVAFFLGFVLPNTIMFANYSGHPHMFSLRHNKPLLISLLVVYLCVPLLMLDVLGIGRFLQLVKLPLSMVWQIGSMFIVNLFLSIFFERLSKRF
ncbi:hypothetical protein PCE1_003925 [Barthelona sp. PCE]